MATSTSAHNAAVAAEWIKDGRWDYSTPGSSGYHVPDITYDDPAARPLKVICIGAGFSGILNAYKIQKECQNVEFKIYEKNEDIGGTWLENRYPGCACDIPSHAYTYNFALNPDWPKFFSSATDIWAYLDRVCDVFDLRKYMNFSTTVRGATWDEERGQWDLTLQRRTSSSSIEEFSDSCDLLLYATGILNAPKHPNIPGIDSFHGPVVHTAEWPRDFGPPQWKDQKIAIIGSGASSIQTLPSMQPYAGHLDVYVRTGVWFVDFGAAFGGRKDYADGEKQDFRRDPASLVAHAKQIEHDVNNLWPLMYADSDAQAAAKATLAQRMREHIGDERLLAGFTPTFDVGCRRVTPGDAYMAAITKPNVDVHFAAVERVTPAGVVDSEGVERPADVIVAATGFDVSYRPRFPVTGRDGRVLADYWREWPESYLGLGVPGFPNFIMFLGPTWPVESGSVTGPLGAVADYAIQVIHKMQRDHVRAWAPRQDVSDAFNAHAQEWYKHTVWKSGCRSWYRDNVTGRVNAVWPGSSLHYMQTIRSPRWEDFTMSYAFANPWAHLGMGWTREFKTSPIADLAPYLRLDALDPAWVRAIGIDAEEVRRGVRELREREMGALGYVGKGVDGEDREEGKGEGEGMGERAAMALAGENGVKGGADVQVGA
ncbi:hypothetical protein HDK77DRAFT_379109 [Phyllosticta capitalensis]